MLHRTAVAMMERPATYWTALPEYSQARKALWAAVNPHTGKRRIDEAFPDALRANTNEQEMFIRFKNGSTWQLVGSDRYDALVGSGVAGVTFSEFALANPAAWGYIRPMLEENGGWAAFITTPRGQNHAKTMYEFAKNDPKWFAQILSVTDTKALSADEMVSALAEYQSMYGIDLGRAMFEQEYLCSFSGAMIGAIYGAEMARAERDGKFKPVAIDWKRPIHTVWDLGNAENNPIWCFQVVGKELRIVDFYLPETDDLSDWIAWLDDHGYKGTDYVPHDIMRTEWGTGKTRIETLREKGRKPKRIPMVSVADGQQAGRTAINAAVFHDDDDDRAARVKRGCEGLRSYRREWDEDLKTFKPTPVKDWAEHIGSAWRYLGLAWRDEIDRSAPPKLPDEPEYRALPDGSIVSNMPLRAQIEAMIRRKRRDAE